MLKKTVYQIGDMVQYNDGRIGTIIDVEEILVSAKYSNLQAIVVRFLDESVLEGLSENFKAVNSKLLNLSYSGMTR